MEQIGQGMFTRVYRKDENTIMGVTRDRAKLAMASDDFPVCSIFPKTKLTTKSDGGWFSYEMPHLQVIETESDVRDVMNDRLTAIYDNLLDVCRASPRVLTQLDLNKVKNTYVRGALREALRAFDSLEVGLDIKAQNVGFDDIGRLILFDIFYVPDDFRKGI